MAKGTQINLRLRPELVGLAKKMASLFPSMNKSTFLKAALELGMQELGNRMQEIEDNGGASPDPPAPSGPQHGIEPSVGPGDDQFLTSEELSKRWKIPIGTIWSMSSKKQLPAVRFAKRIVRYRLSDILKFEQKHLKPHEET